MNRFCVCAAILGVLPAATQAGELCVTNGSAGTWLFTVENRDGLRASAELPPGARLCLPEGARTGGIVAAFEGAEQVEGCSRLVSAGGSDRLLEYAAFDRCRWASHAD